MPFGKYFKGEGSKVMDKPQDRSGEDKGQKVNMAPPTKRKTFGQRIGSKD